MCLAVPGKIIEIRQEPDLGPVGKTGVVDFQGSRVQVSLQLTPDVEVGSWVLVHAGFALEQLEISEARELWEYLEEAELRDTMPEELKEGADSFS